LDKKLHPTNGHIIAGTRIDEYRFIGRVKAAQLFQLAPDPRDSENRKKVDASKQLQELQSMREEVQRLFEGAKKRNVPAYAKYIIDLHRGKDGITPPITLYSELALEIEEHEDGTCFVQVPWGVKLVAIDGETQLAARHEAAAIVAETQDEFVAIYLVHGREKVWARQAFHDLNALGVKPNTAISLGMDGRDPITQITKEVERHVPFFRDRVSKVKRQLSSTDTHVVTIAVLRGACVTLAKGINGVQLGNRPFALDDAQIEAVTETARLWFSEVARAIGPALEDRGGCVASSPAVLAAIGAIGHQLLGISDPAQRKLEATRLATALQAVNWQRAPHWSGIAGKLSAKGTLSVGGTKENAYAVYAALADSSRPEYQNVRFVPAQLALG